jgi:hypothetical protein
VAVFVEPAAALLRVGQVHHGGRKSQVPHASDRTSAGTRRNSDEKKKSKTRKRRLFKDLLLLECVIIVSRCTKGVCCLLLFGVV